jgi:plastocyanin
MSIKGIVGAGVAVAIAGVMAACGGSSSPTSPSGGGSNSGPGPVGATITLTSGGVSPGTVTVSAGQSVMVVNNDSRSHRISSNPHPSHTDCPALNFADLGPGQSATSNALTTARTCGFHDHDDPGNASFQGQVTVR